MRASSFPAPASSRRMSSARSTGTAFLYGRSHAMSASKMSAIVIIRDWIGISSAASLRG